MCEEERNNCRCIHDILKKILLLQKQDFDDECFAGCDKPFLDQLVRQFVIILDQLCYSTVVMVINGAFLIQ